jgi:hypothetical protein
MTILYLDDSLTPEELAEATAENQELAAAENRAARH